MKNWEWSPSPLRFTSFPNSVSLQRQPPPPAAAAAPPRHHHTTTTRKKEKEATPVTSSYCRNERWEGAMEIVAVTSLVDLPINDSSPSPSHSLDAPSNPLVSPSPSHSRVAASNRPLVSPSLSHSRFAAASNRPLVPLSPSHSRFAAASNRSLVSPISADTASYSANEPGTPQDRSHHRLLLDGLPEWSTGGRPPGSRDNGAEGSSVRKALALIICAALVIGAVAWVAVAVSRRGSGKRETLPPPDEYAIALRQALLFFDAQRSGPLPHYNNVSWRGNSGMRDGLSDPNFGRNLVGGFHDDGSAMKITFPASFAMTMLSWSVIEYSPKYEAVGELDHVKGVIKWGIDYLLKTFDSSARTIDSIVAQVGNGSVAGKQPNDQYCWMRPEDINYPRPVRTCFACPELSAETAAALAAASIVFKDSKTYSEMLVLRAEELWKFARNTQGTSHSDSIDTSTYSSSGFWDEFIWAGAWLYYATGNNSYLSSLAIDLDRAKQAGLKMDSPEHWVLSWDNKFPGAEVLMSRLRLFLSPGYPLEELLRMLQNQTDTLMCSYLPNFTSFSRTKGGLLRLNRSGAKPLQYVVNAAFLASLYSDYLEASDVPGWYCGPEFYSVDALRSFAKTQINYILGENPQKMSYLVGYSDRYPKHVHHRGASIPNNHVRHTCEGGQKWRDSKSANPNTLVGAMVSGPDKNDGFQDVRSNPNYTEPTLAGNVGLVAALVSLLNGSNMLDKNAIFSNIHSTFQASPPPSKLWKP